MPAAVHPETGQLLVSSQYSWSWPVHPDILSDTEARVRLPRTAIERGMEPDGVVPVDTLTTAYGELLEQGRSVLQQTYATGDRMPRTSGGQAMDVRQQMAAEIADAGNEWRRGGAWRECHPLKGESGPEPQYGESNEATAWLPAAYSDELAVLAVQTIGGPVDIAELRDIHGHETAPDDGHDTGARWAMAVQTGRSLQGSVQPLRDAAARCGKDVVVVHARPATRDDETVSVENTSEGIEVACDIIDRAGQQNSANVLYAKVRGELAAEHGPPQQEDEKALDALTASIVTARGTNGCGQGWKPPEPALLQKAGTVLREQPERLQEILERAQAVERKIYPPWPPLVERQLERYRSPEPEKDGRDSDGRERGMDLFWETREAEERLRRKHRERFEFSDRDEKRRPKPEPGREPAKTPDRPRGGLEITPTESLPMVPPELDRPKSAPTIPAEENPDKVAPGSRIPGNDTVKMPEPREREAPPRPAPTRQPDRGR